MNILEYTFFQNALAGAFLASILCGFIGTYIVTRRLVFISGGITHASFGGIGIGVFAGINPILSAMIFAILSAFGVQWTSSRKDIRQDSAIAMFWTLGMSVGIICCFLTPGFMPDLPSFSSAAFSPSAQAISGCWAFSRHLSAYSLLFFYDPSKVWHSTAPFLFRSIFPSP